MFHPSFNYRKLIFFKFRPGDEKSSSFIRLVLLGMAAILCGCNKPVETKPEKTLVRTVAVAPADPAMFLGKASYIALVKAEDETDLGFKVGGIIYSIGPEFDKEWDEGTPVKAGTVLAELKQSDFTNALASARAHAELAQKVFERFSKLRLKDAISQQELDVTEANWRTAKAQLDQAEQNLKDSHILAPSDGAVLARYVNSDATIAAGQRILRFAKNSLMSVELGLPDSLIHCVSTNDIVNVEISALEGHPPFQGRVTEVGIAASPETRLYRVVIKVPNPDGILRSGMTARIQIGDKATISPGFVTIPLSALITVSAKGSTTNAIDLAVYVVQNGKATRRIVRTADIVNSSILVSDGLKTGEQVVIGGTSFLYDGAPVDVVQDNNK